jgi:hypothetical protein
MKQDKDTFSEMTCRNEEKVERVQGCSDTQGEMSGH